MKIFSFLTKHSILLFIVLIAVLLRFYNLSGIPASLSADEAALGYTSFSLLKTGLDTHGNFFPISYSAFGSAWTLIGYPLADMLPQLFFGQNEFALRLPSALAGVIGVILTYFIAIQMFENKKIGLFAAFAYAVSPWNVYFSRMAYETNLALPFFLGGLLCLLKYVNGNGKKNTLLMLSIIIFSLTQFIYYSYVILMPLFFIGLFIFYRKIIFKNKRAIIVVLIAVFSVVLSFWITFTSSIEEASTQGIFNDKDVIYERVEKFRTDGSSEQVFIQRMLHTKYLGVPYQIAQNYVNSFSPQFLFDKGGNKIINDIGYFGKLYLIDALFIFVGLISIFYKREKSIPIILFWIFISPISSAITKDSPSSTRLFIQMPLFTLIIGYGINQLLHVLWVKKLGKLLAISVLGLFLLNIIFFIDAYFVHFNYQKVRFMNYGFKQVVELSGKYPNYNVAMNGPDNFPYIYFLYLNSYNPDKFRKEVQYYPATGEGFVFVKSFGRFSFPKQTGDKLSSKTIYVDNNQFRYENKILLPSGEPILSYVINN